ncbi:unnamed protein product, partial [marine sediment metagenome]
MNNINKFKDIHKGKRCFVMGNGYSLNYNNLNLLKDEITIGCNRIGLIYNPTYLCIADSVIYKQHKKQIDRTKSIMFMATNDEYSITNENSKKDMYIVKSRTDKGIIWKGAFWDDNLEYVTWFGKGNNGTVVIDLCIPLAHYMGITEIYLIGVDFTLCRWRGSNREGSVAGYFCDNKPYWQNQPPDGGDK